MKPKVQQEDDEASTTCAKARNEPATGGKKGKGGVGSAGRKVARKTAHSIIERRRREKMNSEFQALKDMVPACEGQEMHKLAILQVCVTVHGSCM